MVIGSRFHFLFQESPHEPNPFHRGRRIGCRRGRGRLRVCPGSIDKRQLEFDRNAKCTHAGIDVNGQPVGCHHDHHPDDDDQPVGKHDDSTDFAGAASVVNQPV